MTIAYDNATVSDVWSSGTPDTQDHTPVGTPRAVAIGVVTSGGTGGSTDHITGASYGALALTRVPNSFAADATSEVGTVCWYTSVPGDTIPTGTQSCTVTQSTTSDKRFVVVTFTAAADCEVVDTDIVQDTAAENPSMTLDSGARTAIRLLAFFSGTVVANISAAAAFTELFEHDIAGARAAAAYRETTPSAGATASGVTAAADDIALSGIAIAEVEAAASTHDPRMRSLRTLRSLRG